MGYSLSIDINYIPKFVESPASYIKIEKDSDILIIDKVLSGETECYEELVLKYQNSIISFCSRVLNFSNSDGEDAAQEVFYKAFKNLSKFKRESSFKTWLYRIALNHCLDIKRTEKRRDHLLNRKLEEDIQDEILKTVSQPENLRIEDINFVREVLSLLSRKEKNILILKEVEELSYEEISKVLNCTVEGVRGRLKRARASFLAKAKALENGRTK